MTTRAAAQARRDLGPVAEEIAAVEGRSDDPVAPRAQRRQPHRVDEASHRQRRGAAVDSRARRSRERPRCRGIRVGGNIDGRWAVYRASTLPAHERERPTLLVHGVARRSQDDRGSGDHRVREMPQGGASGRRREVPRPRVASCPAHMRDFKTTLIMPTTRPLDGILSSSSARLTRTWSPLGAPTLPPARARPSPNRDKRRVCRGSSNAPERIRTSTGHTAHKALNLARLPVPPQARGRASIATLESVGTAR
jgi:hypothetical protein